MCYTNNEKYYFERLSMIFIYSKEINGNNTKSHKTLTINHPPPIPLKISNIHHHKQGVERRASGFKSKTSLKIRQQPPIFQVTNNNMFRLVVSNTIMNIILYKRNI